MNIVKFLATLVFSSIIFSGNCLAEITEIYPKEELEKLKDKDPKLYTEVLEYIEKGYKDPLLKDMKMNPQNYIETGTDYGFANEFIAMKYYIFKPSLEVKQYEPPKYTISVKIIAYNPEENYPEYIKKYSKFANEYGTYEFLYDYDEQKIYIRNADINKEHNWEYIDPKFANVRNEPKSYNLEAAELAFYLAYNKSFFKKPLSKNFKKHIKTGNFKTFADYKK